MAPRRWVLLRQALGALWIANALFHFMAWVASPAGAARVLAAFGQAAVAPAWLQPLLQALQAGVERAGPRPVAAAMVLVELALGAALLAGYRVRGFILLGLAYSLLCWLALDALGWPYGQGQTDPGVFVNYALAFVFAWRAQALAAGAAPGPHPFRRERLLFGLLWAFDAALKWQPGFLHQFMAQLTPAAAGQPAPIAAYIQAIAALVAWVGPMPVALLTALAETLVAASLLSGRALRWSVPLAALYCLAVWSSAEGFGGPYSLAGTGVRGDVIGNVLIYVYLFAYLWPAPLRRPPDKPAGGAPAAP